MGMKYCKRKIPRLRKSYLTVVISFPVIRENQEELDNEMWSVEDPAALQMPWTDFETGDNQEILAVLTTGIDRSL